MHVRFGERAWETGGGNAAWRPCPTLPYLPTTIRGRFFYLYLVCDLYSRKIVGWEVYETENSSHAARLIRRACRRERIRPKSLVLHSDNGSPMKGATLLATLHALGVVPSFSRPSVSNDNAYSEALFRTLKYRPNFPKTPFDLLDKAQRWVRGFVDWYNQEHRHSALKFVTPSQRHDGLDRDLLEARRRLYLHAKARNPNRWSRKVRDWTPPCIFVLNPDKEMRNALGNSCTQHASGFHQSAPSSGVQP